MEQTIKNTTYLAISIGPIYQTIQRAKRTRELWVASFILSRYMREILVGLEEGKYGDCLSPDVSDLHNSGEKYHGAGIWNDNCFYALHTGKEEQLKADLPKILQEAKGRMLAHLVVPLPSTGKKAPPLDLSELSHIFDRHFYGTAILHTRESQPAGNQEPVLIALGKLLASAESLYVGPSQHDDYVGQVLFRPSTVLPLYNLGFDKQDTIFTQLRYGRRLPSLLEIAVAEFKQQPAHYQRITESITAAYQAQARKAKAAAISDEECNLALEEISGTPEEESGIIEQLKLLRDGKGASLFKKRHKYVAIVQSDGDGIGKIIKGFQDGDVAQMKTFSKQLMDFSKDAVGAIANFGGIPIYAGGDDLLFVAPLQNQQQQTLFDLLTDIRKHFAKEFEEEAQTPTVSFGISIFYYKSPMGEALMEARTQLFRVAKKLAFTPKGETVQQQKNAMAFRVLLHGGQAFGCVLQQEGKVWQEWEKMLKARKNADAAFLSGLVHSLESLEVLLEDACDHGLADYFFKKHFNEAKGEQKTFVNTVRDLAKEIYQTYGTLPIEAEDKREFFEAQVPFTAEEEKNWKTPAPDWDDQLRRRYCNNLLYSALRFVQFLNADDHD